MTKKRLDQIEKLLESGKPFIINEVFSEFAEYYIKTSPIDNEIHKRIKKITSEANKITSKIDKLRKTIDKLPIGEVPVDMATEYIRLSKFLGVSFPRNFLKILTVPAKTPPNKAQKKK